MPDTFPYLLLREHPVVVKAPWFKGVLLGTLFPLLSLLSFLTRRRPDDSNPRGNSLARGILAGKLISWFSASLFP
jgi:hypothetical protein